MAVPDQLYGGSVAVSPSKGYEAKESDQKVCRAQNKEQKGLN